MKFTLTVTDASTADIARLMAAINGMPTSEPTMRVATNHPAMPQQPAAQTTGNDDDDESGDSAPVAAGTLDADNLPHDNRIHSDPPKLTSKGVWRKRRGVNSTLVATVETELRERAKMQPTPQHPAPMFDTGTPAPQMPQQQPAPQMPQQPQQPMETFTVPQSLTGVPGGVQLQVPQPAPQMPQFPSYQQPQQPQQQPAPQMPQQPQQQPAPQGAIDFHTFMQTLSAGMQRRDESGAPLINADYLAKITSEIATAFGRQLNAITDIANDPNMIVYAVQLLQRDNRWQ